jgi:hypothetical protein
MGRAGGSIPYPYLTRIKSRLTAASRVFPPGWKKSVRPRRAVDRGKDAAAGKSFLRREGGRTGGVGGDRISRAEGQGSGGKRRRAGRFFRPAPLGLSKWAGGDEAVPPPVHQGTHVQDTAFVWLNVSGVQKRTVWSR